MSKILNSASPFSFLLFLDKYFFPILMKKIIFVSINLREEDGEESFTEENFEVPSPVKSKNNVGEFTLEKENYSGNLRKSTSGKRAGAPPPLPPRKPSTLVAGLSPMPLSTID
tara:strand:- start:695 stop:1033 length:339 start_codon:yes stop_codon:yes gene_type:complete